MELQDIEQKMQECKLADEETAHCNADGLLCELAKLLASRIDKETEKQVEEILQVYGWLDKWYS